MPPQRQKTQSLWEQAELHASRREWPQAIACFNAVLELSPGDSKVLVQLSYVESLAGHYRAARGYALRALEGVRHGAPDQDLGCKVEKILNEFDFVGNFRATDDGNVRLLGLGQRVSQSLELLLHQKTGYGRLNERRDPRG